MRKFLLAIFLLTSLCVFTIAPVSHAAFSPNLNRSSISFASLSTILESMQNMLNQIAALLNGANVNSSEGTISSSEALTLKLLSLRHDYDASLGFKRQEILNQLSDVAVRRQQALIASLERDPSLFAHISLPETTRKLFPSQIQLLIETETTVEGTLTILHSDDFDSYTGKYFYKLKTKTENLSLYYTDNSPEQLTGSYLKVTGLKLDNNLLAAPGGSGGKGGKSSPGSSPTTIIPTFGAQKTLVIAVNFQDQPTNQPFTIQQINDEVFITDSNFFRQNSYGQTWLEGDVAGWYTIPLDSTYGGVSSCPTGYIADYAKQAATNAGVDISAYNHYVYFFPTRSGCSGGLAYVGGNPGQAWINGFNKCSIICHELGHEFGLLHSHALECGNETFANSIVSSTYPNPPPPGSCYSVEYGDVIDIMGSGNNVKSHFVPFVKERLGWLNYNVSPPITTVTTSGTYTVNAYEDQTINPKAVKIYKSTDSVSGQKTYFYLEARKVNLGFTENVCYYSTTSWLNGLMLRTGRPGYGNTSYLLDTTPQTTQYDFCDGSLVVGQTFFDPDSGVSMITLATSTGDATISIALGTPTCVHRNPIVSISPANQVAAPGAAMTYYVSIINADSSACPSSTFTVTSTLPTGWSQTPTSLSSTLAPGYGSGNQSVSIKSAVSDPSGMYPITETATNNSAPFYTGSGSATYTVDSSLYDPTPPTTIITSPQNGATIIAGSAVTITADATDDKAVIRVEFYVNNTFKCSDTIASYTCFWAVPKGNNKIYQLQTKDYDAAGNVGISPIVSVTAL